MSHPANTVEASPYQDMRARARATGNAIAGAIRLIARIWRRQPFATIVGTELVVQRFWLVANDWPQR